MDNDEDDDGNFTKWMSSYWGHGAGEEQAKERKRSFRRPTRPKADRRASLPCQTQLDAMHLQNATMLPTLVHLKTREEKEVRSHPRARRVSSDENSRSKASATGSAITTIPELAESFERRLRIRNQKLVSLSDANNHCLICHEDMRSGAVQDSHCSHRFHKEAWKPDQVRPRSSSSAACERRKSGEMPFSPDHEEYCVPRRQLSLRRQR